MGGGGYFHASREQMVGEGRGGVGVSRESGDGGGGGRGAVRYGQIESKWGGGEGG